jgi:hypothetical protein
MAEHLTRNEDVGGSIPPGGSMARAFSLLLFLSLKELMGRDLLQEGRGPSVIVAIVGP